MRKFQTPSLIRHVACTGNRGADKAPVRWLVEGAHGQYVSQLPDRRSVYDVFITPNGYVVDKRSL